MAGSLMLVGLVDCRCPDRKKKPATKAAPTKTAPAKPMPTHFPSRHVRTQMRELDVIARELKRRAKRGKFGNAPKVAINIIDLMPRHGSPKIFVDGMVEQKRLAQQLLGSKRPQHHYAFETGGRCQVDEVIRFENIAAELGGLLGRRGLAMANLRNPAGRDLGSYYDREGLDLVNAIYARDFEILGYARR